MSDDEVKLTVDEKLDIIMARLEHVENRFFNLSQAIAEKEYGRDAVLKALAAGNSAKMTGKFASEPHPYDALVRWHMNGAAIRAN
jgi:predicted transcriptional regulator